MRPVGGLGSRERFIDFCIDGASGGMQLEGGQAGQLNSDWIECAESLDFERVPEVVSFGVGSEAVGVQDEGVRFCGFANGIGANLGKLVDSLDVGGIDLRHRDIEGFKSGAELPRKIERNGGSLSVAVVLDYKKNGEIPERGNIETLVDDAFTKSAIT